MNSHLNTKQINQNIGKTIAKRRQQAGFTQEQVAEYLGIGYEAVSRMERGLVMPTVVRLYQLAELFDCKSSDLLDENSPLVYDQIGHWYHTFLSLNEDDRKIINDIMQTLCDRLKAK